MDYTPPSYKGMIPKWEATPTPTQHHLHHHQEIEWMSSSNNSSSSTPTMTAKVEVIDEDDGQGDTSVVVIEREHMFDKVVTPSDVGKLNRLVIPKQHAEKYFPLDSSSNEKGLLLNFEDRTGKPWRFRYSYWNSSQSYVMTKGWSRFVKEKKLDAGDVVSFQRGVGEVGKDKLFIDWRRRPDASAMLSNPQSASQYHHHLQHHHHHMTSPPASAAWTSSPTFMLRSHPYSLHQPYPYPPTQGGGGGAVRDHQGTTHHHLSSMSLMNVLPSSQSHPLRSGSGYGFGFGNVVNPYPVTGSLIFLSSSSSSLTSSTSAAATTTSSTLVSQNVKDHQHHQLMQQQQQGGRLVMQVQREDGGVEPMVYESVPVVQGKSAAKRLRLFGVNMECPISHQTHDFDILSSSLASSSTPNHPSSSHHHHNTHYHQQLEQHQQHTTNAISMGPPSSSSSSSFPSSPSHHHQQHPFPSQLRPIYSGAPPEKGCICSCRCFVGHACCCCKQLFPTLSDPF